MVLFPSWFSHAPLFNAEQHWQSLPEEAAAKPEASKHQHHKHLMFKHQVHWCVFSVGRCHSSHLLGKPRPALNPCMHQGYKELLAPPLAGIAGGMALNSHPPPWYGRLPPQLQTQMGSEPPQPSSCTGYFLLNQGLSIFRQRKAFLNSQTLKGLCVNWTLWTTSGIFPCYIYITRKKKRDFNRFVFNLL